MGVEEGRVRFKGVRAGWEWMSVSLAKIERPAEWLKEG